MLRRSSKAWALVVVWICTPSARAQIAPNFPDLAYSGHARQKLDLYLPPTGGPFPLVVWIHGGGWQSGDKFPCPKAGTLLQAGFAVASLNYRLSGDATFPAQIQDCKGAIRWLRAHAADFGLDPLRVASWGSSAGGHLSALVGVSGGDPALEGAVGGNLDQSSAVQVAADYFGPADMFTMGGNHNLCNSPESLLLGVCLGDVVAHRADPAWADEVALATSASPVYQVGPDDPPFHVAHGTADPVVPVTQSIGFAQALSDAVVPVTLRLIEGAGHGLPTSEDAIVRNFLVAWLISPPQLGDLNADGAIDAEDARLLTACLTGPAAPAGPPCSPLVFVRADSDSDSDADLQDWAAVTAATVGG